MWDGKDREGFTGGKNESEGSLDEWAKEQTGERCVTFFNVKFQYVATYVCHRIDDGREEER